MGVAVIHDRGNGAAHGQDAHATESRKGILPIFGGPER
jgi:hypothetical protein